MKYNEVIDILKRNYIKFDLVGEQVWMVTAGEYGDREIEEIDYKNITESQLRDIMRRGVCDINRLLDEEDKRK